MKGFKDESVDVVFADPPFNLDKKYGKYKDKIDDDKYIEWSYKWISEVVRITKPTGSIFIHNIPKWLTYYASELNKLAIFKHWIAWDAMTSPMGKSLQPAHYGVLYYVKNSDAKFSEVRMPHKRDRKSKYLSKDYGGKKDSIHPFGPLISDTWTDLHRIKHNKFRDEHPCQLPISILERIILMSSDEGDLIFDPFLGSGTTAVAAKHLGRSYCGIDIDENYIGIVNNKLDKVNSNSKLGDIYISHNSKRIITLRNNDWDKLSDYFDIPKDIKEVDYTEVKLKKEYKKLLDSSII